MGVDRGGGGGAQDEAARRARLVPLIRHRIGAPGDTAGQTEGGGGDTEPMTVRSLLPVGQFASKWASYNAPSDLPYDEREEAGGSLVALPNR